MKGSCLCGAIQYTAAELSTDITHCYCQTCRKAHSAAFNTTAGVKPEHFQWTKGEDQLAGFQSSKGKVRYFCPQCGTHMLAKKEGAAHWVLRLGSLDDDPQIRPKQSIWCSQKSPWLSYEGPILEWDEWSDR